MKLKKFDEAGNLLPGDSIKEHLNDLNEDGIRSQGQVEILFAKHELRP